MKAVIFPAAALIVGLAGGTGASWLMKRGAAAAPDAHAATAVDSAHVDAFAQPPAAHEAENAAALPPAATTAAQAQVHAEGAAAPAAAAGTSTHVAEAQPDTTTLRLARIFGAMRPEDAARLLEPLDDVRLRSILLALSDRKAAAILAKFKGERSATLARALANDGAH